jgi:hypothetical protein
MKINQEVVKELFDYHEDGYLTWKVNKKRARVGDKAGCFDKSTGYIKMCINQKRYHMQRIVWLWHYGSLPNVLIDHEDQDKLNNKVSNLRIADDNQNQFNRKKTENTSSKYKGVSWYKRDEIWVSSIMFHRKSIYLGRFIDEIEAAKAYDEKAKELFGDFALLNF